MPQTDIMYTSNRPHKLFPLIQIVYAKTALMSIPQPKRETNTRRLEFQSYQQYNSQYSVNITYLPNKSK